MRGRRLKVLGEVAVYHCVTRAVAKQRLFGEREKEVLRKQLWQVADFCGVQVLTYALMSNHFHVLVRVNPQPEVSDEELLRRVSVLYGAERAAAVATELQGREQQRVREVYLARMGDVSQYMKELKQRFSIWYNRIHQRVGTLWAERFKSTLVERKRSALLAVSAYVDLNSVRAGLVKDPKDYRFCGYGEALGGSRAAQNGLSALMESGDFDWLLAEYRTILYGIGNHEETEGTRCGLDAEAVAAVLAAGGKLSKAQVLRCRLRYFSDGAVLGSRAYVDEIFQRFRERFGSKRKDGARPMKGADWGDLCCLRDLRGTAISVSPLTAQR